MNLAAYRRKFPNIDWSKMSPAAEFAMAPEDVASVFAEIRVEATREAFAAMEDEHRAEFEDYTRRCGGVPISPIKP